MPTSKLPLDVHPIADIFPMMSAEEFQGLKKDIQEHGLLRPLVMWKGQLVDGRNRLKACVELGVDWQGELCDLEDDIDPVQYVVSHNFHRRNLTTSQRAVVGNRIREFFDEQAKQRQGTRTDIHCGNNSTMSRARDAAGEAVGVSGKLIDAARTVSREGSEELAAMVEAGEVSVTKAAKIAKTKPKAEQAQAAKEKKPRKPKAKAKPKAEPQPEQDESPQYVGVFQRLREVFDLMSPDERNAASSMWQHWIEEA